MPSMETDVLLRAPGRLRIARFVEPVITDTPVDPEVRRTVDASAQWTSSTNTPYAGMELPGQVMATFLHGRPTVLDGAPVEAPAGSAHA